MNNYIIPMARDVATYHVKICLFIHSAVTLADVMITINYDTCIYTWNRQFNVGT